MDTTPGGDEYVVSDTTAPNSPCHVPNPDVVSDCGLSELPSSIHSDDKTEHDAVFVQTCVEEVKTAKYAAPRGNSTLHEGRGAFGRGVGNLIQAEGVRGLQGEIGGKKKLCYAKPTRRSWPLKQGSMGDISQLKENLEQKITTWQTEVDLKLIKSVWGAQVRTPEEDELSEECICEPPGACLCCHRPPEIVQRDLLYAYQGFKDTTKDAEPVEDHLPASIHHGASNLHSDEDLEDKIKLLDPRVQKLIRTYLEVF